MITCRQDGTFGFLKFCYAASVDAKMTVVTGVAQIETVNMCSIVSVRLILVETPETCLCNEALDHTDDFHTDNRSHRFL